jgi:tight adherence protein B
MQELILVLSFISVFMFIYGLIKGLTAKDNPISRINNYISAASMRKERKKPSADYRKGLGLLARGIKNARFLDGYKKKVRSLVIRAHVPLKAEEVITICFIAFAAISLLMYLASRNIIFTIVGGIAGWYMPLLIIRRRITRRLGMLNGQLGDAVILISNSLKAGSSFIQAIDAVTKEMDGPIAVEFNILQREIALGVDTQKALENMVERVRSEDLEILVAAVLIQRQTGGNLAEILDNISSTIRDRVRIKKEIRTLTAQGRYSGYIISLLPIALAVIIFMINPEHLSLLFVNPIGITILVISALMEIIGIIAVKKIVKIEV